MRQTLEVISGIYKVVNPIGQIYIGKSENLLRRWRKYKYAGVVKVLESINQHGFKNHTFEIIEKCDIELLNERERYWIKFYDCFDTPHGLNLQDGGSAGHKMAKGSREKVSKNSARWNIGKSPSEETRRKISEKVSISLKGHQKTLGYKYSEEKKKELDEKKKATMLQNGTKIIQPDNNKQVLNIQTGVYYDSIRDAAESSNFKYEHLTSMLNGNKHNKSPFIQVNPDQKTKVKCLKQEEIYARRLLTRSECKCKKLIVIKNKKEVILNSVADASKYLGICRTYVSRIINGKMKINNLTIKRL